MRIARVEAVAFGAIGGRELDLPGGLVVLHGPNESGKSSTLDLVRGVLFGFPRLDASASGPLRVPRGGGERSGVVVLERDDGTAIRVVRTHRSRVRVYDADGEELGEAALGAALGGVSDDLFRNVLTFDERELARLTLLDGKAVREGILGTAVMGGGVGLGTVAAGLGEEAAAIYSQRGRDNVLNGLRHELEGARRRLRDASDRTVELDRLRDLEVDAVAEAASLREEEQRLAAELARCDRLLAVREAALVDDEARSALERLAPPADALDDDAIAGIEELAGRLPVARDAARRAAEAVVRVEIEREAVAAACRRVGVAEPPPPLAVDRRGELARAGRSAAEAAHALARTRQELAAAAAAAPVADPVPAAGGAPWRTALVAATGILMAATVVAGLLGRTALALAAAVLAAGGLVAAALVLRGRPVASREPVPVPGGAAPDRLEAQAAESAAAWEAALRAAGLPVVDPADADALLAELGELERRVEARDAAVRAERAERERVDAFAADARIVLGDLGERMPDGDEALLAAVERIGEAAARSRADLDAHRARAAELSAAAERAARDLGELAAGDADLPERARRLDPVAAEVERDALVARLAELRDGALAEADERVGDARGAARTLAEAVDAATAAQEIATAEADYRAAADRWLTLRLAERLADDTRRRFADERQPEIVARASERIREATDGAWQRLRLGEGDGAGARSVVIGADGEATPVSELSAGAVGLVYLCLRIGLVEHLAATTGVAMPVVMDDVLTHLDPDREAGAARLVADLAERHQVLYLTCHEQQVQALRAAAPGLRVLALDRLVGT